MAMQRVGELIEAAKSEAHEWRELDIEKRLSDHLDREFLDAAQRLADTAGSGFFTAVTKEYVAQQPRPDAINHHRTLLPPNVISTDEQNETLVLVDLMHRDQVEGIKDTFVEFMTEYKILERVMSGEKFNIVSNHFELADQGFTLGYLHKAAREIGGADRLENYVTTIVGRLIGYFDFGDKNVLDGVLRKAGGILKSFPVSGGEALDERGLTEDDLGFIMRGFRRFGNHQTRHGFDTITESNQGHIILQAGGGAKETVDMHGNVPMNTLAEGTRDMLANACLRGAWIIPAFVDYGHDLSLVEFAEPVRITDPDDIHEVGEVNAAMGNGQRGAARQKHPEIQRFNERIIYAS